MNLRSLLAITLLVTAFEARPAEVVRAGRWELHGSFWMAVHQTLMHDASTRTPRDLSSLSAEERKTWEGAIAVYREHAGPGSITFSRAMMALQDELTQFADDAVSPRVSGPVADALRSAAPVYRARWWPSDQAASRFFIGYAAALLRDAGEELVERHEAVYGERFPTSIRVDVTPFAGTFGAYTHLLREGGVTVTVSSRDPGYAGLAALEAILHESSHAIVHPVQGGVADAISLASKKRGIEPPRDLWHAILFATTSELTKRALAARGASAYVPFSDDLLTRAWPKYREPIERFWYPYLNGKGTLEEAVEQVVLAVP